jgi:hypothetical protein
MAKPSEITLPNGTVIKVSNDMTPDQITAMITALTLSNPLPITHKEPEIEEPGVTYIEDRTVDEIWNSSKRERVALFMRTFMSDTLWFNAKDIQDQQLAITGKLSLGETSAISTYLNRLYESAFLDRKKQGSRNVYYRMTPKLAMEYPLMETSHIEVLLHNL